MSADSNTNEDFVSWLADKPEIEVMHVGVCDLNGIMRGKRIPIEQARRIADGGIRMPLSIVGVDVWGEDIVGNPLVFVGGDSDGICTPTGRGALPINWTSRPSAMIPLWLFQETGEPFYGDPRQSLALIGRRYAELGLTPVVATELEFYLVDPNADSAVPPISPYTGKRLDSDAILSLDELEDFGEFFRDVYAECQAQNVPADTAVAENGIGQFEINMLHTADLLKAADDAVLFKRIVKGVARKHKLVATFMAKPYGTRSGNGFHVHFSVNDASGNNVFNDGTDTGSPVMHHAVAGLLSGMAESTLLFAPHFNSYRRLRPDTHAPSAISWGYENRTTAVRIPGGNPAARRIEHRVSGADANPYLVLAGILGAALVGIQDELKPPKPFAGRAYSERLPKLPADWASAVNAFEDGEMIPRIFEPTLQSMFVACKRQEIAGFASQVTDLEFSAYLEIV
ncbi:glutamine synthetase family protein [Devosia rhodophyticola]|uniref:Glutamine synthetase family protein n=1 Tax=Devosia rhodophyticola TaxID=3026423 RepID=A0ABY7Z0E2_9HYPH|nr:glutamine synthetase family protein [Devosia rhodophyticola]WDR06897.1 glutamine synthetase family protein [Devosia rhodophyticola]